MAQDPMMPPRFGLREVGTHRVSAQDIIVDQMNRAPKAIESQPDVGSGLLSQAQKDIGSSASGLGGSDVFGEAIKKRYEKNYGQELSKIQRKEALKKEPETFRRTVGAAKNAALIYQNEMAYQQALRKREADDKAERNQVLSSVLGFVGTIGGAIVGGPAGAIVGSQLGKLGALGD